MCVFWMLLPKFNFWKGDSALGHVFSQIWVDFPNISLFPKILSLKSIGNSWGNLYSKFAMLDITIRFTCGESDLYSKFLYCTLYWRCNVSKYYDQDSDNFLFVLYTSKDDPNLWKKYSLGSKRLVLSKKLPISNSEGFLESIFDLN